jgi:hypothetical protein
MRFSGSTVCTRMSIERSQSNELNESTVEYATNLSTSLCVRPARIVRSLTTAKSSATESRKVRRRVDTPRAAYTYAAGAASVLALGLMSSSMPSPR